MSSDGRRPALPFQVSVPFEVRENRLLLSVSGTVGDDEHDGRGYHDIERNGGSHNRLGVLRL